MIEINVKELIEPLLKFESNDDFYYLQILQRKKDNPNLNMSNSKVIKNYYIKSSEHLNKHWGEITTLCKTFNARAMLRLNKRSFRKVAFNTFGIIANIIQENEPTSYTFLKSAYDRSCGQVNSDKNKKWIMDIDYKDGINEDIIPEILSTINMLSPVGDKLLLTLPTKNGCHLIVSPFNSVNFSIMFPKIDIHKDNPINLYYFGE